MNSLRYFDFGSSRSLLLLIARIAIVVLFIIFGYPKLTGFSGTVQYMTSLGAPMPMLAAIIVQNMPNTIANTEPINFIPEGPLPGFTLFIRFLLYSFLIALSGLSRIALMAG